MNQVSGDSALVIRRGKAYVDKARAYKVLVDGNEVGRIKNGEEAVYPLPPGRHELLLKIDWATSPSEIFELGPGQRAIFECKPKANAANALIYMTVKRKDYLTLQRVE